MVKEKSLANKFPEIAKEWHPTKNGDIKPTEVSYDAGMKVWWQCSKGEVSTLCSFGIPGRSKTDSAKRRLYLQKVHQVLHAANVL